MPGHAIQRIIILRQQICRARHMLHRFGIQFPQHRQHLVPQDIAGKFISFVGGILHMGDTVIRCIRRQTLPRFLQKRARDAAADSRNAGKALGPRAADQVPQHGLGVIIGLIACVIILLISGPIISLYNISEETVAITKQLISSLAIIAVFQTANSILTKGVLRGGGDTKFLMVADILFLWIASVPLGYLCGITWGLSPFITYTALKIDQIIKAIWCVFRLKSNKWIKRIY